MSKLRRGNNGQVLTNSALNFRLILEEDPMLKKLFAFNEFSNEIEVVRDIPDLHIKQGDLTDSIEPAILDDIEYRYSIIFNDSAFWNALTNVSRNNSYNPIIQYLERVYRNWDHTRRVQDFLPMYLGAEKGDLTTLITKQFFVGCVGKAFDPGMKFDQVLDLVGGQGIGKTTLLKKLANGFYTDSFTSFTNKDDLAMMVRSWIVNDDEMTVSQRTDFATLKKFISQQRVEYRKPYGKVAEKHDKGFVIARTTNQLTYLKDRTGDRRFWPIKTNRDKQKLHPFYDLTQEYIDQLWGEFTAYYKAGFDFRLSREQEEMLDKNRAEFMYIDEVEGRIVGIIDAWKENFITSREIADGLGDNIDLVSNHKLASKIKYVMDNKAGWKPKSKKISGTSTRGYERI